MTPASERPSDGLEEARQAKAEQVWEEAYARCYDAREALLDSLSQAQRFIAEETSPGVFSEAHIQACFRSLQKSFIEAAKNFGEAQERFREYFEKAGQGDTLRPPAPFEEESESDADKPISLWPTGPAPEGQSGEAAEDNGERQAH